MASSEKVKKLFEEAEIKKQYFMLIDQITDQMKVNLTQEDDEYGAMTTEYDKRTNKFMSEKLFGLAERVYAEFFSDQEIDELIVINNSPVFIRFRNMMPEIITKMMVLVLENEKSLKEGMIKIAEEVEQEFKINN